jgi:16S rRNA processing protein RimM
MYLAGEIGKAHGIKGEVYVVRISDDPGRFEAGSRLVHADGRNLTVESSRPHRDRFLVKFEEASTRTEAEGLRGALYVPEDERRDLGEAEFWIDDLIGAQVVLASGESAGRVTAVIPGVAHDLLEVVTENGPRLVPVVKEIVVAVDVAACRVTIDPPEGLME